LVLIFGEQYNNGYSVTSSIVSKEDGQKPIIRIFKNYIYILNYYKENNLPYLKFYRSINGGKSFDLEQDISSPSQIFNLIEYSMCVDNYGNIHVFWIDHDNDNFIYYRKSSDNGNSFTSEKKLTAGFEWVHNPYCFVSKNNELYLIFQAYKDYKIDLYFIKSIDGGETFSIPYRITNNENIQEDDSKVIVYNGTIYVSYIDYFSTHNLYLVKSTDGGLTFSPPIRINKTEGEVDFGYDITIDSKGNIFVVYKDITNNFQGDLIVAKSSNGGETFTYISPLKTSYSPHEYPHITISDDDKIYLTWVSQGDSYFLESRDGGTTWINMLNLTKDKDTTTWAKSIAVNKEKEVFITAVDLDQIPFTTVLYKLTPENQSPVVDSLNVTPTSGNPPLKVKFFANAHDVEGRKINYKWDFNGDGKVDEITSTGISIFTYTTKGIFNATVTIDNDDVAIKRTIPIIVGDDSGGGSNPYSSLSNTAENSSTTGGGGCSISPSSYSNSYLILSVFILFAFSLTQKREARKGIKK